jgi:hypothetical protein
MKIFSILDGKNDGKVSESIHGEHSPLLDVIHSMEAALKASHISIEAAVAGVVILPVGSASGGV